jgi:hypothetical protein
MRSGAAFDFDHTCGVLIASSRRGRNVERKKSLVTIMLAALAGEFVTDKLFWISSVELIAVFNQTSLALGERWERNEKFVVGKRVTFLCQSATLYDVS